MLKICISGGPGGGKSSCMSVLSQMLAKRGYKTLICPETATELILNGICPGGALSNYQFQEIVFDKQVAKEALYDKVSRYYGDKTVILYDRGICDQLAYISGEEFDDLLKSRGCCLADVMCHYDAVFDLVTAADGAEEYYQWNDPSKESTGNNPARSESPEEAREKELKTRSAWIGHPHLRIFDNSTDFTGKLKRIVNEVFSLLGEPIPKEVEHKFLICRPSEKEIRSLGCVSSSDIVQTYLKNGNDGSERRIRMRGTKKDGFSFYYTKKKNIEGSATRHEVEDRISPEEYINYLSEADPTLHQIVKTRYCFVYKNQYFELDIYPDEGEFAILELEVNDLNAPFELPPVLTGVSVTGNEYYRNHSIAKRGYLEVKRS